MPVRVVIHSSLVSRKLQKSLLLRIKEGRAWPDPRNLKLILIPLTGRDFA